MLVNKSITLRGIMRFSGHHLIWLTAWMLIVATVYHFTEWKWLTIPWLPVSLIGTAVAFYVGFKNNQAYDRLWEGRKVWGGIINSSRAWGSMVRSYIHHQHDVPMHKDNAEQEKKQLIHRQIAWVYTLRRQLLQPTNWEHMSLGHGFGSYNRKRSRTMGIGLYEQEEAEANWNKYISHEDQEKIKNMVNPAVHLIDLQVQQLASLREHDMIDGFKQGDMQRLLNDMYEHQGKVERIKRFPLPRQYGSMSFIFVCIFIFLLPLGVVSEFAKLGTAGIWISVPFGVLIGWVYVNMELIGDYSENPFEGLFNDVPMLSICRTIEIDLLQMLGEKELPTPIQPKNGILM